MEGGGALLPVSGADKSRVQGRKKTKKRGKKGKEERRGKRASQPQPGNQYAAKTFTHAIRDQRALH